ncbi:alginate lyase family protein [Halomonas saccharevitans]|uniref:alginate lyase family protein n=1 Tax=Halomonas saccharevitans TaxID=416872 RepID=UPI001FE62111|nr:alginate lyase family protein [Halomonas saccharevitans]
MSLSGGVQALSLEERQALDLSHYVVTRPGASYFDVAERRRLLATTDNALLLHQMDRLDNAQSCRQSLAQPVLSEGLRLPSFYPRPQRWYEASRPYFRFEDTVSGLAGAYMTTGEAYYADCLVRYLDRWARHDGLLDFHYQIYEPQAWYATESMIFAAAMAYSIVRPAVEGEEERTQRVEAWLNRLAHRHAGIPGRSGGSCCNNHFYRRALYASMVGVLTEDDALFRFGVSAVHSALAEMTPEGGFPRELARGRRALHYQNYALLYLITNMQVIARQGYDIFDLSVEGRTIHDGVELALRGLTAPSHFHERVGLEVPEEQYLGFIDDPQYFAWMEIYQARYADPRIDDFLRPYRAIYNRSAGGYLTLYFMSPEAQQLALPGSPVRDEQAPAYDFDPYGDS